MILLLRIFIAIQVDGEMSGGDDGDVNVEMDNTYCWSLEDDLID